VSREDYIDGFAQRRKRGLWERCRWRDNGDGTATVIIGSERQYRGKWTFIGKTYVLPVGQVKEKKR